MTAIAAVSRRSLAAPSIALLMFSQAVMNGATGLALLFLGLLVIPSYMTVFHAARQLSQCPSSPDPWR